MKRQFTFTNSMYLTYYDPLLTYTAIEFILNFYLKDSSISDTDPYVSNINMNSKVKS